MTFSASDLLKSFASLVLGLCWLVGDMLVDLTQSDFHVIGRFLPCDVVDFCDVLCAFVSVEHVRQDFELKTVVQHCRNLVAFLVSN